MRSGGPTWTRCWPCSPRTGRCTHRFTGRSGRPLLPQLFGATTESNLALQGVAEGRTESGAPLVTLWFRYDWLMAGGARTVFDVVDVLELAPDGRIGTLRIIYDTTAARPLLEQQTGQASWRPGD